MSNKSAPPARVLLVDTHIPVGKIIEQALLAASNLSVHFCSDANSALHIATQSQPTIILQDLMLEDSDLTGLALIKAYRMNPATRDIPILALSCREDLSTKHAAFEGGVNDYLLKMPDTVELLARIRYHSHCYRILQERNRAYQSLHQHQQQLQKVTLALHRHTQCDGLTGLANSRFFRRYLDAEWKRATHHQTPISLLMIDIDHFKAYNDVYGHLAGDEVLKKVAHLITTCAPTSPHLAAHFSGPTFILVLSDVSAQDSYQIAEKICHIIQKQCIPHRDASTSPWLTVSVGMASLIPTSLPAVEIISLADQCLYAAKLQGRNRVVSHPLSP